MKAVSLLGPGRIAFVDIPEPKPGPDDVIVAVAYVGLCGTDLNAYRGRSPLVSYPRIPGHEIGGTIVAKGENVPARIQVGAHATVSPYSHCGTCTACRKGRVNCCQFNQTLGVQRDGALAERIAIGYNEVYTSSILSPQELALAEPLAVGCHAANRGRICEADTVLVLGCGAVGLGAIAAAARKGASIIGVDVEQAKLDTAVKLGAGYTVNAATDDTPARVASITGGEGAGVVIEAAGQPETYRMAMALAASTGRVVCVGYASSSVDLDTTLIVRKELEILGSRNALDEFRAVIAMLEQRERPFADIISRIVEFEQTPQAFADWSASPQSFTKILVRCGTG